MLYRFPREILYFVFIGPSKMKIVFEKRKFYKIYNNICHTMKSDVSSDVNALYNSMRVQFDFAFYHKIFSNSELKMNDD